MRPVTNKILWAISCVLLIRFFGANVKLRSHSVHNLKKCIDHRDQEIYVKLIFFIAFWASSSRTRLRGFRQIWTVSMSQRRMWVLVLYRYYIVPASSVATGSLRWTDFSGCRMTGWQPASLRATQLPYCCRCWPLTQDRWILGRLQKCVHLSVQTTTSVHTTQMARY